MPRACSLSPSWVLPSTSYARPVFFASPAHPRPLSPGRVRAFRPVLIVAFRFRSQGLRTWQQHLAHERFLLEAEARIRELEAEVEALMQQQEQRERQLGSQPGESGDRGTEGSGKKTAGWWPW